MTFEELLELGAEDLEKLTDEQLLEYLGPCLKNCPPIDIQIVNESEAKVKLEKLAKKNELKEQKKQERLINKTTQTIKQATKPKVTSNDLAQINAMIEMMKKSIEQNEKKA